MGIGRSGESVEAVSRRHDATHFNGRAGLLTSAIVTNFLPPQALARNILAA